MYLVKVISSKIDKLNRRVVKILKSGKRDTRTAFKASPYGVDSAPVENDDLIGLYTYTGRRGDAVLIGYINRNAIAQPGELRLYSTDKEAKEQLYIYLKNDGTAEFNGENDFLVRFLELEKSFNDLKADHNALVEAFNAHQHTYVPAQHPATGTTAPTNGNSSAPVDPSEADITPAKIDNLKTEDKNGN